MDRVITYVGQSVYEWLFSKQGQSSMVGLAKLSAAMFGSNTVVNGLSCVPTGPASLQVVINPGEIYSFANLENSVCGTLPTDSHSVMKQGVLLDAFTTAAGALPAPGTAGQSVNYLIEAQYSDSDVSVDPTTGSTPVVLQFFNSSNPGSPWSGPGGLGGTSNTFRKGIVSLQVKAGAAATTGSQTTPSPDAGWTGLWVVTVANGQTQILAGNITQYAGAPILPSSLLASIQNGNLSYAVATGTANAHVAAFTPAITARVDGMLLRYKAPGANTTAVTLNDGIGPVAVVGANHAALQGGEYITNGDALVMWNSSIGGGSYILLECTGGALQIAPATQSQHAVPMAQAAGVVGSVRNLVMSVTAASATATLTADEIIVETALGGVRYCLPSVNKVINLATTGAGGMDTGSAPASGYVAVYAIWNPTTQTAALLARNAATLQTNVYSGANMPAGYTASALVGVWPTNGSGQFVIGYQSDRMFIGPIVAVVSSGAAQASYVNLSIASAVPANARSAQGWMALASSVSGTGAVFNIAADTSGTGNQLMQSYVNATSAAANWNVPIRTAQQISYNATVGSGTANVSISVTGYTI